MAAKKPSQPTQNTTAGNQPLPPGWVLKKNNKTGRYYAENKELGVTSEPLPNKILEPGKEYRFNALTRKWDVVTVEAIPPKPTTPLGPNQAWAWDYANKRWNILDATGTPTGSIADQVITTPTVVTPTKPSPTTRPTRGPGMTAAEAAAIKYGELSPGTQPGDIVGGPDRVLDNGGAVVAGRYIPPGFTVGGISSAQTGSPATGGTGGGGAAAGAATGGTTETGVPTDWEQAAQEIYGGYYAVIKSVPEIATLLQRAVAEGWSDTKFDYELSQTAWWKTTSESARQWDIAKQTDPADAQQKLDVRVSAIKDKALTFGVRLSDQSVSTLAEASIRGGWSEQILDNAIGAEAIKSTAGVSQLRTGYIGQTLKQTAANYGVTLSDTTFNDWVNKVAVGQENEQSFQQYALATAKALYPGIAAQLDSGSNFQQIVDPYRQLAGRILEMNSDNIDFTDPKWARSISYVTDKGEQRPMNNNEWASYLRQDRTFGYEFTSAAKQQAYQITNDLANLFGKV